MEAGTPIRYKIGHLGVSGHADHIVREGDTGVYVGPHPSPDLARKDWHITEADMPDGAPRLQCPVQTPMFEAL